MNNIIINKSIIKCTNSDNGILKCSINNCICNNNKCKCFRVDSINNIYVPYPTPFANNIPPDNENDVNMVDKQSKINHVKFGDNVESIIFNTTTPPHHIVNIAPRIKTINDKPSKPRVNVINNKSDTTFNDFYGDIVADDANFAGNCVPVNYTNDNTNNEPINVAPSGYVHNDVFADPTDDIYMSDITTNDIQMFESAKSRRHDKRLKEKKKV